MTASAKKRSCSLRTPKVSPRSWLMPSCGRASSAPSARRRCATPRRAPRRPRAPSGWSARRSWRWRARPIARWGCCSGPATRPRPRRAICRGAGVWSTRCGACRRARGKRPRPRPGTRSRACGPRRTSGPMRRATGSSTRASTRSGAAPSSRSCGGRRRSNRGCAGSPRRWRRWRRSASRRSRSMPCASPGSAPTARGWPGSRRWRAMNRPGRRHTVGATGTETRSRRAIRSRPPSPASRPRAGRMPDLTFVGWGARSP